MYLKITNKQIEKAILLLDELPLKNKYSIARSRIKKLLLFKYDEYKENLSELVFESAEKDDDGTPVLKESESGESQIVFDKDKTLYALKSIRELENDIVKVDIEEYELQAQRLLEALENIEVEFCDERAETYELLYTGLEDALNGK